MNVLKHLVALLLIIGGLNWGLVGLWHFDLVVWLVGSWPTVVTVVYDLVGLAAVIALIEYLMKASK